MWSNFLPNLQRGGGHVAILHTILCNYTIMATQRGRPWPNAALNTPLSKTKDRPSRGQGQGHRRKCSPKKKGLQKFFSGDLKKKSSKNFFRRSLLEETKKKVFADFPQSFWRFPTKFQRFKNSAVLEPRTGQFSRTLGFEAKDFKMCSRGQGRPRGLHLWLHCLVGLIFLLLQKDIRFAVLEKNLKK